MAETRTKGEIMEHEDILKVEVKMLEISSLTEVKSLKLSEPQSAHLWG